MTIILPEICCRCGQRKGTLTHKFEWRESWTDLGTVAWGKVGQIEATICEPCEDELVRRRRNLSWEYKLFYLAAPLLGSLIGAFIIGGLGSYIFFKLWELVGLAQRSFPEWLGAALVLTLIIPLGVLLGRWSLPAFKRSFDVPEEGIEFDVNKETKEFHFGNPEFRRQFAALNPDLPVYMPENYVTIETRRWFDDLDLEEEIERGRIYLKRHHLVEKLDEIETKKLAKRIEQIEKLQPQDLRYWVESYGISHGSLGPGDSVMRFLLETPRGVAAVILPRGGDSNIWYVWHQAINAELSTKKEGLAERFVVIKSNLGLYLVYQSESRKRLRY